MLSLDTYTLEELFELKEKLPHLVASKTALLVKKVPSLKIVHELISAISVFPQNGRTWAHLDGYPNTVEVSNIPNSTSKNGGWFGDKELNWHTNGIFLNNPETCVALFCEKPAASGGQTEIINTRRPLKTMSEEKISQLTPIEIQYERTSGSDGRGFYELDPFELEQFKKHKERNYPGESEYVQSKVTKPLLQHHPVDSQLGIYYPFLLHNKETTSHNHIQNQLIHGVREALLSSDFRYVVDWEPGDLLFMDQIHSLHRRCSFTGPRRLNRIAFWWEKKFYKNGPMDSQ